MEVRINCALWLSFLLGCGGLLAFNLDTENVLKKTGDSGSLFGFSLAMHRQLHPVDRRILLVGAPKAKALNRQKSSVTGGLYNCDMSSTSSSCSRVIFDNDEDPQSESKENQWMGVSVSSQGPGGKVLTCAHRYQLRSAVNSPGESRDIIGRCYMLDQDLTVNEDSGGGVGGSWHFCRQRNRGHELFGSCQQGVAAIFDNNFHYVIFGAPGGYNWKGIVRLEQRNETLVDMGIFEDGPFEMGDETDKNPEKIPVPANSYLGFSLDSGMSLIKKGKLTVVAGAPRANYSGAVMLIKKGPELTRIAEKEYILEGEGLASSFGYDVAVLDLNGDSWQDIVVGAPQYFEKDGEIGGAVYVYVNKAGKWDEVVPTRIDGPQDSMFGLAVANLGDINQDGYHDFAVGAPNHDGGSGSVYIFHGSATGLKSKKPSQILSGKPLGGKMFGYSLAANMDLDKNFYPDLAVGSLSDAVFVYRARPVISITKEITFTPEKIDLTTKNCVKGFCLNVKACLKYTANPPSYSPSLTVRYLLEADAEHRKNGLPARATFPDNSYKSDGTIVLNGQGKNQCKTLQLVIQDNIRDKLHGIPIDVSVTIEDPKRKRRQSVSPPAPVLDANEPNTKRSMVHFIKEGCGSDNICESNLDVKYQYGYGTPAAGTFTPLRREGDWPVISLSDQKDIALEVTVTNQNGDDAHEASIVASLPPSLTYSTYHSLQEQPVICTANKEGTKAECELGNPFKTNSKTTFYIILSTSGISYNTSELEINLKAETTSKQDIVPVTAKAKVAVVLQLSVSGLAKPSQVYFTGEVKGESAMKSESDIGSPIAHQFRIINLGKHLTDFGPAFLEIDWPKETDNQKWLLYLVDISATGLDRPECFPKDVINNLKVTRTRRAVKSEEEAIFSRLIDKKSKTLSCGNGAKCVKIKCRLQGLESNAVITLSSRLWNSTFIEDYSDFHHVEVIVSASLRISSALNNTMLQNAETKVRLTVFPEARRSAQFGGVPWWIIVLSVLFGLLLLALLAFLLWKCGFFERTKHEDMIPSYNAVRIKREERAINAKNGKWENMEKKPWMTTWHDSGPYS